MQPEYISLNNLYQHQDFKRVGRVVLINEDNVTLQDDNGDRFLVPVSSMEYAPVFQGGIYWIDLNVNYPRDKANALLCRTIPYERRKYSSYTCTGGADLERFGDHVGQWCVTVDAPYDPETDSDARVLGYYPSQSEALQALWDERFNI